MLKTPIPMPVVDIAAIGEGSRSLWLLLAGDGGLVRFDADSGETTLVARVRTTVEEPRTPHGGNQPRLRLHASRRGEFAAVCRDFGQFGEVVDLRTGKVTLSLDGGAYHAETVPFSFAFADIDGRVVAIHRSEWNRLDLSDPATGQLLSARELTKEHGLDYFHGELYVSPDQRHVLEDGWVWHPVGIPAAWDLERWRMDNPWESEDGPSRVSLCVRAYSWNGAMAWIDERRVAIEGLGDDDRSMEAGARIFDITAKAPREEGDPDWDSAKELFSFKGPRGRFFGSRGRLLCADPAGLTVWNPETGEQIGTVPGFVPTHQHVDANELACVVDGVLIRRRL